MEFSFQKQHGRDSRVLNQVPEPESKIVTEIRDDPLDLNVHHTAAAAEQEKDDVPSSAALLDDPSPVATESEVDPYREPKAIPKLRPPVFVYPHSEGKISPKFRQRFREVVNIFMYNIRGSAELRESTQFIDYTLRICGQSPETSHPSILVFCRQRDFKPLHGLLSNDRLRFQYSLARGESTHYDRLAVSAEHNDTVLTSGGSTYSDGWIGQQTENLQIDTSDDSEEYLMDDGEYESFTDEESDTEHVIGGARKKKGVWQLDWERNETPVVSFPQLAEHDVLGELDLDWALVKLEDADNWRPNAVMAKNGTDVIFLTGFASEYPERETPVLIATSGGAQFSGNLHSIPSVLGGVNGRVPSVMRTVTLDGGKLLSKGGSGSVVVDALTNQIFGHVVASNPLGEVYVSPVIGLLDHLKARYRETQVRLPEPLRTLRDMIAFHVPRKNPALVDKLILHYAKLDDAYASTHPPNKLHQAIHNGDVDSVRPLLKPDIYMKSKDHRGGTALHAASLLDTP
ncbi:hypothetical protein CH35J_008006 [Colletotrichum higginsianum]|uniref:Uncharacterized protein n=1 Tax=Colletotrichum higginsianum TaxID=80884 RepID=A0A4T0VRT3_9PEZI|nr:hypothetical protein CH35J_008006 [Colletotrichum higginsianum]